MVVSPVPNHVHARSNYRLFNKRQTLVFPVFESIKQNKAWVLLLKPVGLPRSWDFKGNKEVMMHEGISSSAYNLNCTLVFQHPTHENTVSCRCLSTIFVIIVDFWWLKHLVFSHRGLNTAAVETLQETVLRRLLLLWMEQSIVSNPIITAGVHVFTAGGF